MDNLTIIIIGLLVAIIIALILNQKFGFSEKFNDKKRLQKTYDDIHEKYKKLLNK